MRSFWISAVAASLWSLAACTMPEDVSGARSFAENCAACHGAGGKGDGAMAALLRTAPPDLTGLAFRNGGVFPRNEVMSTIDGFARGDHVSQEMPIFGDGDLGPTVIVEADDGIGTPIPVGLLALADYLESIQVP